MLRELTPANYTACNLYSGISGWLRLEIIRAAMDYHSLSDDVADTEPFCAHGKESFATAGHQRRKVACVIRVSFHTRIIMSARSGETCSGAGSAIMNMHGKNLGFSSGKSGKPGYHQNSSTLLKKLYLSCQTRRICSAADLCYRIWTSRA